MNFELRHLAKQPDAAQAAALAGTMQQLIDDLPEPKINAAEVAGPNAVELPATTVPVLIVVVPV